VSAGAWLPILAALASPLVVAASYARQQKKAAPAITQALMGAQQRSPKYVERGPPRWYHVLVITALFVLPFVQWFAFLQFQTRLSFLIPLVIAGTFMFVVGAFYPRFVPAEPLNRVNQREAALRVTILAAALIIAFILPSSGMITLIRGVLSDILALVSVAYLIRAFQKRGS